MLQLELRPILRTTNQKVIGLYIPHVNNQGVLTSWGYWGLHVVDGEGIPISYGKRSTAEVEHVVNGPGAEWRYTTAEWAMAAVDKFRAWLSISLDSLHHIAVARGEPIPEVIL